MKKKSYLFLISTILVVLTSCKSKTNINYMEDIQQVALASSKENSVFTIQPGDHLMILVSAKDNNVAKPFNQNYSSSENPLYSTPSSNVPTQTQVPFSGPTYTVGADNSIQFPELGLIRTENKSTEQLKNELQDRLKKYIKEPSVSVRLVNFKISVLGEVNKAGRFTVPDGQNINVLEAIAMAGDLTIYGERNKIMVLRNTDGTPVSHTIDISKSEFINSPYYFLKQNDIIVVPANKTRQNASAFGPQTTVWISVASVALGLLALFVRK
ncbi:MULTISPECIES: polysaccharide biosynthesis/export family protein [Amniculibacterium]|uniref:polysaccharide biosynthesis/export family protein n=1 Tax=Amniculibacterium TaxID=2715289 RepID=UPI0013DDA2E2|nr:MULTISPECIES: polysaccharide biosynthesis/export family protein [Amniculibacterium]